MDQALTTTVDNGDVGGAVVETVAEAEGVPPEELPPLYGVVDPDALDGLFAAGWTNGRVVFTYAGYEVTVRSDGSISVRDE